MFRRIACPALAVLATAAIAAVTVGTAQGNEAPAGSNAGPPYNYTTELMGEGGPALPLKDQVLLTRTALGYSYRTGQQNNHLVVTRVDAGLRFVDTGTDAYKKPLSSACQRKKVRVGIAAVCRVPDTITVNQPLLIEVWPRLGNDYTNTTALPATFATTVLGDKGHDVARFGAGPDFFNGFSGNDQVYGGGGNDWIRTGLGNDAVEGGAGNDDIVAKEGRDTVRGGDGNDRLWSGDGDDRLRGGTGADFLLCGNGHDNAKADSVDRVAQDCGSHDRH